MTYSNMIREEKTKTPWHMITMVYNSDGTVEVFGDHVDRPGGTQKPASRTMGWLTGEA